MNAFVPQDAPPAYEDLVPQPSRRRHRDRTHRHHRIRAPNHLPPSPPPSPPQGLGLGIRVPRGHVESGQRVSRLGCDPPPYSAEDASNVQSTLSFGAANSPPTIMSRSSMSPPSVSHIADARFPPVPPHSRQPPDNLATRTPTATITTRSHPAGSGTHGPRYSQDFSSSSSWSSWSPSLGLRSPLTSPPSRSARNFPGDYLPTGPHITTPPHSVSSSPATGPVSILSSGRSRVHGHRSPRVRFVDDIPSSPRSTSPLPQNHAIEGGEDREDDEIFAFDPIVSNNPFSHYVPSSDFSSTIAAPSCTCGKEGCRPPGRLTTRPPCSCGGASCPGGVIAMSRSPPGSTTMASCLEQPRSSSSSHRRRLNNGTSHMTRTITAPVWSSTISLASPPPSH